MSESSTSHCHQLPRGCEHRGLSEKNHSWVRTLDLSPCLVTYLGDLPSSPWTSRTPLYPLVWPLGIPPKSHPGFSMAFLEDKGDSFQVKEGLGR